MSHQFPVAVVVVVVGGAVIVVVFDLEVVIGGAGVVVVVGGIFDVVVVDVPQDAKTSDVTMRKVIASQITPFFKISSFFSPSGKLIEKTSLDHQLNI